MNIRIISEMKDLLALQSSWRELESHSGACFYNSFKFVYTWWSINITREELNLFVIVVEDRNKVIAIAPLMLERTTSIFPFQVLKFIGKFDHSNFLISREYSANLVVKKIVDTIEASEVWDKLYLTHLDHNSPLSSYLLRSDKYNRHFRFFSEIPNVRFEMFDDFNEYKKTFFRSKINYYRNKLSREHSVRLQVLVDNESQAFEKIVQVHQCRNFGVAGRRAIFSDEKTSAFYKALYEKCNTLTFLLTNESETISYATAFIHDGTVHNWNMSFNPSFSAYCPGDLVYFEMLNYLFQHKSQYKVLDLGGGRYPWKYRLTNDVVMTYCLNYNNESSKNRALLNLYDKIVSVAKVLLRNSSVTAVS